MKAFLHLLALGIVLAFAFWAYQVNYDARAAMRRVDSLNVQVAAEREAIAVLKAEWAYLNRPERLAALVKAHEAQLGLIPLDPEHFADAAAIAYPRRGFAVAPEDDVDEEPEE
ncbi:MAG: cell division protein FtsL [Pseudomonadota bacterium]